jgi:hypothetical protein
VCSGGVVGVVVICGGLVVMLWSCGRVVDVVEL